MNQSMVYPSRNIKVTFPIVDDDLHDESGTIRARSVTGYLNRYHRLMLDANQTLVDDSLAVLAMKRETCYATEVIIHWAARLIELVRPLVQKNSVIVCAPPSTPRDHLVGIQLVALAVAVGLEIEFIDDGLTRTHAIGISIDRDRNDRDIHRATMAVNPAVTGTHVILMDDVLVSGTTMSVCAELLMESGAFRVDPVSIAQSCKQA
jgi:phosphoribosylpyrophosphate synthetase